METFWIWAPDGYDWPNCIGYESGEFESEDLCGQHAFRKMMDNFQGGLGNPNPCVSLYKVCGVKDDCENWKLLEEVIEEYTFYKSHDYHEGTTISREVYNV